MCTRTRNSHESILGVSKQQSRRQQPPCRKERKEKKNRTFLPARKQHPSMSMTARNTRLSGAHELVPPLVVVCVPSTYAVRRVFDHPDTPRSRELAAELPATGQPVLTDPTLREPMPRCRSRPTRLRFHSSTCDAARPQIRIPPGPPCARLRTRIDAAPHDNRRLAANLDLVDTSYSLQHGFPNSMPAAAISVFA